DCEPRRDHRRLIAEPAGDPARSAAAAWNPTHLARALWPNLHAAGESLSAGLRTVSGFDVSLFDRTCLALRPHGFRHSVLYQDDGVRCELEGVDLVAAGGSRSGRAVPVHRFEFSRSQFAQGG